MNYSILKYDGSFNGLLSCVFLAYEQKLNISGILPPGIDQEQIFSDSLEVITEDSKAQRVLNSLKKKLSNNGLKKIQWAFLSEESGIELKIYKMLRHVFASNYNVESDFTHQSVLEVTQIAKKVAREKHRMEAFVRFRLTKDEIYFAVIEPDFNVLPLITRHFKSRYADQKWLIYDLKRKIGVFYDMSRTEYVSIELPEDMEISGADPRYFEASEIRFQKLWKEYFDSTNIKSRVNMRLHVQHVPKRYWKYLSEKSSFT
ncbi:TIGR03915 family putative DNA repair protein [Christiangramia salexigens]|uniref:DNA metabolism protein n=1 Tax=Christiangramia salexigens TaxID=1913577 RepID=A0A1L3J561_9FLAO|nr:TIGR03915 family putative DNA repair protein [Christiangramia salexigens]APG60256.1 DNA metabolism protein [Christiangramia salexigens]